MPPPVRHPLPLAGHSRSIQGSSPEQLERCVSRKKTRITYLLHVNRKDVSSFKSKAWSGLSVARSVGRSDGWSVCHDFLKGREMSPILLSEHLFACKCKVSVRENNHQIPATKLVLTIGIILRLAFFKSLRTNSPVGFWFSRRREQSARPCT